MLSKASGADLKLHVIIEMEGAYRTGADLQLHVIIEADGAYTQFHAKRFLELSLFVLRWRYSRSPLRC